jgi:hypothetical protein
MGDFLSIRLQLLLSAELRSAGHSALTNKRWWNFRKFHVPASVLDGDLALLESSLASDDTATDDGAVSIWSHPLALLVKREWTCVVLSDAAYSGLGGWSPSLHFMWRITAGELQAAGLRISDLDDEATRARARDPDDLHINVLEFVAIIINVWLTLTFIRKDPAKPGGHIICVLADNTSALSWFRYAARSHRPAIRNLAFFCQCLIVLSQTSDFVAFKSAHIPGSTNCEADALSRPELFPTMGCAIRRYSRLLTCRAYLLPFGLLSTIARVISSPEIAVQSANETTTLLTLEPRFSPLGADGTPSQTGYYKRSHRGRRS